MSRNPIDKAHKCTSKKAYPDTSVGKGRAEVAAREIMRKDLRGGMVHIMSVYVCKYSGEEGRPTHLHVGTKTGPFSVLWHGKNTPKQWAEEMGITWTPDDEAACQEVIRGWYANPQR